jgi:two-component system, LytTR family, response regulator
MKREISCILVEDEAPAAEILKSYLENFHDFHFSGYFVNAFDAQEFLGHNPVDLAFLDIQLPGLTGLEFLKSLQNPPLIVITSAYSEHGVEAYDLQVFDYLLKPYSLERFAKTVNRVRGHLNSNTENRTAGFDDSLIFRVDRKDKKLRAEEILLVESQKEYVKIVTGEEAFLTKMGIAELRDKLPDSMFLRVHRSFLVNRKAIRAFGPSSIDLGFVQVPVGRLYRKEAYSKWKDS